MIDNDAVIGGRGRLQPQGDAKVGTQPTVERQQIIDAVKANGVVRGGGADRVVLGVDRARQGRRRTGRAATGGVCAPARTIGEGGWVTIGRGYFFKAQLGERQGAEGWASECAARNTVAGAIKLLGRGQVTQVGAIEGVGVEIIGAALQRRQPTAALRLIGDAHLFTSRAEGARGRWGCCRHIGIDRHYPFCIGAAHIGQQPAPTDGIIGQPRGDIVGIVVRRHGAVVDQLEGRTLHGCIGIHIDLGDASGEGRLIDQPVAITQPGQIITQLGLAGQHR